MSAKRGVYFLADDGIVDLATAFLNSFRRTARGTCPRATHET
ncbi:hypothetical protein RI138_08590 [Streptomyces sp. C11-1]|uniref:Uncharacterized protein n=1 Tax=Streptomyces durocortorensis TaxID=2811104 RepID=A0ABY9VSK0_9ACTN|nr:hypothetical protein [Streptomyces durocortorensis]WNF26892.1 hypothetical protein RI138_08590 [Streptomyces durocortorensis]